MLIAVAVRPAARGRSIAARATRGAAAAALLVLVACAAVGWLYVLRHAGALDAGPRVRDALPLQRLAGDDSQPLLRLVAAWAPAGCLAGLGLSLATGLRRPARAALTALLTWATLFVAGAVSDAVTASEPLGEHVAPQLARVAVWLPALLMAVASLIPPPGDRRTGAVAAATRSGAGEAAAA
jgi:hypothetical protein